MDSIIIILPSKHFVESNLHVLARNNFLLNCKLSEDSAHATRPHTKLQCYKTCLYISFDGNAAHFVEYLLSSCDSMS